MPRLPAAVTDHHRTASYTLAELARRFDARLDGDGAVAITHLGSLENAGEGAIAFLANARYRGQLATTRASAVILTPGDAAHTTRPKLVSENPYATFARIAQLLHPPRAFTPGIDPTARVDPGASVANSAAVGPYAVVEARARIAERAQVGSHCVVGEDSSVGEDAVLNPHVTLYPRTSIGARTVVHSGAVIGADGFGLAEAEGRWIRIPQTGRVVIGADCDIGANTTIDRGAIEDTVLGADVKLDNQIQIGHNCVIGDHTAVAGCVGVAGSTRIGRNCRIGGAAMISGHLSIADGTIVGGASVVFSSIESSGYYTSVMPLQPYREWQKTAAQLRNLARLRERVIALEQALRRAQAGDGKADRTTEEDAR
ncbi:MAG TPA: UDP-3-O-(3-hydroxymyristoyl)glucosamine N-acyltransferase [Casimicrobiaceae bacterium]